jgi:homospermidine synthase
MVSHVVKRALFSLAADLARMMGEPSDQQGWARPARDCGVKGIHIAARDSQRVRVPERWSEFVNTWSSEGFLSEVLKGMAWAIKTPAPAWWTPT